MERIQSIIAGNIDSEHAQTLTAKCMRLAKRTEAYRRTYSEVLDVVALQQVDSAQRFAGAKLLSQLASDLEHDFREIATELLWYLNYAQQTNQFGRAAASISQNLAKEHPDGVGLAELIRASRQRVGEYFKDDASWLESLAKVAEGSAVQVRAKGNEVAITRTLDDGKQVERIWSSEPQSGQLAPVPVESLYGRGDELLFAFVLDEGELATDRPVDLYADTVAAMVLTRDRLYQHVRELEDGNLGILRGSVIPWLIAVGVALIILGLLSVGVGIILNIIGGCSSSGPPSTICDVAQALLIGGIAAALLGAGLFLGGGGFGTINGIPVNMPS